MMGVLAYKKIFLVKIVLGVLLLFLFLLLNYYPKFSDRGLVHKIVFVVDNLPSQDDLLQEEKQQIFAVLDMLKREGTMGEYNFALVSTAGSGRLELPFVEDVKLFRQYVDALVVDTNVLRQDSDFLHRLLLSLGADEIEMMSSYVSNPQRKDHFISGGLFFEKVYDVENKWLMFFVLMLFILFI